MRLIGLAVVLTLSLTLAPLVAEPQATGQHHREGPPTSPQPVTDRRGCLLLITPEATRL
jgi:hypothetical protein